MAPSPSRIRHGHALLVVSQANCVTPVFSRHRRWPCQQIAGRRACSSSLAAAAPNCPQKPQLPQSTKYLTRIGILRVDLTIVCPGGQLFQHILHFRFTRCAANPTTAPAAGPTASPVHAPKRPSTPVPPTQLRHLALTCCSLE